MEIQILQMIDGAKKARGVTVIIDVFRACTLETYMLNCGAEKIIPVGDIDRAFNYKKHHPEALLIGERGGKICPGFDFGNSPSQIKGIDFSGKTVIHTTSAGTQGIANAKNAELILAGCFTNAKAVAQYIKSINPKIVSLVCMGLEGKEETQEDTLCARYIKSILENCPLELSKEIESLKYTSGAKFFDKNQKEVFPEEDFYLCTKVDIFHFILQLKKHRDGISVMERIDI